MEAIVWINYLLSALFITCYGYQFFYMLYALLFPKKTAPCQAAPSLPAPSGKRYALLICARNEEAVIGDLLEQAGKAESLTFTSSGKPNRKMMGMGQFKATLGLMPDINNTDRRGLRTMIVVEGKPAHNAGIRSGDVLLKVAGKQVHTLDDYMEVLKTLSFGEQIQVRFISKASMAF